MRFWNYLKKQIALYKMTKKVSTELKIIDVEVKKIAHSLDPNLKSNTIDVALVILKQAACNTMILMALIPDSSQKKEQEVNIFFELVSFLAHMTSRYVFKEFGPTNRQNINDIIGPILVEYTVSNFYKPISKESPKHYPKEFKQTFYDYLNTSEIEYSACIAMVEDVLPADKKCGVKSKGLLNLLEDNVVKILNIQNPMIAWTYLIMATLGKSLELKELEDTVLKLKIED